MSKQSICNVRSVCNRYVSNDCTVRNVPRDVSVVSNIKNKKVQGKGKKKKEKRSSTHSKVVFRESCIRSNWNKLGVNFEDDLSARRKP